MKNLKFLTKETMYLKNNDLFQMNSVVVSINHIEVYPEPSQKPIFTKIVNCFQPVTVQPLTVP